MKNQELHNLSSPQMTILEMEKLLLTKCNHILVSIKFGRKLNSLKLEQTLNKIIELNDSFRIVLVKEKDKVKQYIKEYEYEEIDVDENVRNLDAYIERLNNQPIDIYSKLFKFKIVNYKTSTYVLYKAHHIINDAWGVAEIGEQIKEIYPIIDDKAKLSSLNKPSYISFINKEDSYLHSSAYERDYEFWKEYLKTFSTDKIYNRDISDIDARREKKILDPKVYLKIQDYCQKNKISEHTFFLAIFSVYYFKIHNIQSLNIGTPFLNRTKEEMKAIGLYITNLPLNVSINSNKSFLSLCNEIRQDSMKIFRRARFPHNRIQKIYKEINFNSNMFEVGYSYQINALNNKVKGDLGIATWYFPNAQNQPITLHVSKMKNDLELFYDYLINVITQKEVNLIHDIIIHLISQVLIKDNIEILIKDLMILNKKEKEKINKFNNTGDIISKELTISEVFNNISNKYSRKIALKINDQTMTYSELARKINGLAIELRKKGVRRNTPIMLFFDKSFEMIISMLAIIKAGGCYIPVLPEESLERIQYIIDDANPIYILTSPNYVKKLDKPNLISIELNNLNESKEIIEDINTQNDLAYIIYTSGSTGNPKGTKIMHKNIMGLLRSMQGDRKLKPTEEDISMSLLKYSFDASGIDIYSALLVGGKLILISKEEELNPYKVVEIMEKEKITRSFLVPKWLEQINQVDKKEGTKLEKMRILGTGGEIFKPKSVEHLFYKYPKLKILNLYGPTETTMFTTYNIITEKNIEEDTTTIGKPIKYSRAYVINEENEILPTNVEGELVLAEDSTSISNIAEGYLNLDNINDAKFINIKGILNEELRAYKTGDIVKINNKFELEFIGRSDDIVKINNGYLVSINEVKQTIDKITFGKYKTCVIPINVNITKMLILIVEGNKNNINVDELKKQINNSLPFYMRIKEVFLVDKFPINNSGKIDRKYLKELIEAKEQEKIIVLPETKTQELVYELIKNQIDLEQFSIKDDFIDDLSIDSLDISVIFSLLDNPKLKIQDLYTYTTTEDLANFIDGENQEKIKKDFGNVRINNNVKNFKMEQILLTGATGFFGIHLFWELLHNEKVEQLHCIIRKKHDTSAYDRLINKLKFYYRLLPEELELIKTKVNILEGDINQKDFGLNKEIYDNLRKNVTTVINSAANVNHYGKYKDLYQTNVEGLRGLIKFCGKKVSLAHISTLSVAGFKKEDTIDKIYDENTLYIKQTFNNNPYLITKFEAESILFKSDVNVKVFRLGNIMPRVSDGKFQENYTQNAFLNSIRLILKLNKVPKPYLNFKVEFSPVEECSEAICKLIELDSNQKVYHIINDNLLEIQEIIHMITNNGDLEVLSLSEFTKSLENYNEVGAEYIKDYILQNNVNLYSLNKTLDLLNQVDFSWSKINKKYLANIQKIITESEW